MSCRSQHLTSMRTHMTSTIVLPGQLLGSAVEYDSGEGTYIYGSQIFSSQHGYLVSSVATAKTTLQVVRNQITKPIPGVGDIVTAKVTKLFTRYAVVDIMCVNSCPLSESYQGKIRREDVRALDIDSVEIFKSFRPGDIIRASVISLGDAKSYYLSTAQNELGVVLAHSSGGHTMIPLNWLQMQCPITKTIEFRKVAKIVE